MQARRLLFWGVLFLVCGVGGCSKCKDAPECKDTDSLSVRLAYDLTISEEDSVSSFWEYDVDSVTAGIKHRFYLKGNHTGAQLQFGSDPRVYKNYTYLTFPSRLTIPVKITAWRDYDRCGRARKDSLRQMVYISIVSNNYYKTHRGIYKGIDNNNNSVLVKWRTWDINDYCSAICPFNIAFNNDSADFVGCIYDSTMYTGISGYLGRNKFQMDITGRLSQFTCTTTFKGDSMYSTVYITGRPSGLGGVDRTRITRIIKAKKQ